MAPSLLEAALLSPQGVENLIYSQRFFMTFQFHLKSMDIKCIRDTINQDNYVVENDHVFFLFCDLPRKTENLLNFISQYYCL